MTSRKAEPSVERRRLCAALKRARLEANLTQRDVAVALEWSLSKVIRIESGVSSVSVTDLRAMLSCYKIDDQSYVAQLEAMARVAKYQPFSQYRDLVDKEFAVYLGHESAADGILQYQHVLIPGLLQTEDYSRAVLSTINQYSGEGLERRLELRRERQAAVLENESARSASFIIDEGVLLRQIGGEYTHAQQIKHLLRMAERDAVSIQVVPFSVGGHPGLGGPFVILEFDDASYGDVLFLESSYRGDTSIRDDQEIVARYKATYYLLLSSAIDIRSFYSSHYRRVDQDNNRPSDVASDAVSDAGGPEDDHPP